MAKSQAKSVTVKFIIDKPKVHSVLFREVVEDQTKVALRSLYVSNVIFSELGSPKALLVTLTAAG